MMEKLRSLVSGAGRLPSLLTAFCVALVLSVCNSASAQVVLPDLGVDVGEHIDAFVVAIGLVIAGVLGVYLIVLTIRKFMTWIRRTA